MESLKGNILIVLFVAIILALGYWAVTSVQGKALDLARHASIEDVGPVVTSSAIDNVSTPRAVNPSPAAETPTTVTPNPETPPQSSVPTGQYADLQTKIQGLINDKVFMKKGSRGTRVGTVQKFLIAYGVSMKVDNDYGDSVANAVKKFQKEEGLTADGETGPTTYQKMIEWLKNN